MDSGPDNGERQDGEAGNGDEPGAARGPESYLEPDPYLEPNFRHSSDDLPGKCNRPSEGLWLKSYGEHKNGNRVEGWAVFHRKVEGVASGGRVGWSVETKQIGFVVSHPFAGK